MKLEDLYASRKSQIEAAEVSLHPSVSLHDQEKTAQEVGKYSVICAYDYRSLREPKSWWLSSASPVGTEITPGILWIEIDSSDPAVRETACGIVKTVKGRLDIEGERLLKGQLASGEPISG